MQYSKTFSVTMFQPTGEMWKIQLYFPTIFQHYSNVRIFLIMLRILTISSSQNKHYSAAFVITGPPSARACLLACLNKSARCVYELLHWEQRCGFSPEWIIICRVRWPERAMRRPHTVHTKGRSPVCVRACCLRSLRVMKARWHTGHSKFFSPVCCLETREVNFT